MTILPILAVAVAAASSDPPAGEGVPIPLASPPPTRDVSSSADEIASGAETCMVALDRGFIDNRAIVNAGWNTSDGGGVRVYSHNDHDVRISAKFTDPTSCVVHAYAERPDSAGEIRDAVRTRLAARFGADVDMEGSSHCWNGQAFLVGDRIGILCPTEYSWGSLSVRFIVNSSGNSR